MKNENPPFHIVAVTGVVIKDNKFLAGRRTMDEIAFPGKWTVPGGKVENGESIEQAVRQEIKDEAGVEVGHIFYVGNFKFKRPDDYYVIGLEFGCQYKSGQPKAGEDMETMRWLTIEEAEQLDFIPGVVDYVKRASEIYKQNYQ